MRATLRSYDVDWRMTDAHIAGDQRAEAIQDRLDDHDERVRREREDRERREEEERRRQEDEDRRKRQEAEERRLAEEERRRLEDARSAEDRRREQQEQDRRAMAKRIAEQQRAPGDLQAADQDDAEVERMVEEDEPDQTQTNPGEEGPVDPAHPFGVPPSVPAVKVSARFVLF